MTTQEKMKSKLESIGIPYKQVECYGRQIVITSHCADTANRWAGILSEFATVRGVVETVDDAKENKGTCLLRTKVKVWRTFAAIC